MLGTRKLFCGVVRFCVPLAVVVFSITQNLHAATFVTLGKPGDLNFSPYALSDNGSTTVGKALDNSGNSRAYKWILSDGFSLLGSDSEPASLVAEQENRLDKFAPQKFSTRRKPLLQGC